MPNLTVNNNTYAYPDPGTEPGWGQDATDWASDVTTVLDSVAGTGTISETQALIALTATDEDIPGLLFNNTITESAQVIYRILRVTTGGGAEQLSESGILQMVYNPAGSTGEKWLMSRQITAGTNTRVSLNIDDDGQVTYSSLTLTGASYSGYIKFKTITILRTG